ncbi:MAG: adenosylcobinamide-GDP ribazoletransferase, partial [Acidimicrobiales bacterium]
AALGGAWVGLEHLWPAAIAAALVVLLDVGITGALHFDGLADASDGLLPHADRQRRLMIMADPSVGAFGMVTLIVVVLTRYASLATLSANVVLIMTLWATSRSVAALAMAHVPYARDEGIATNFLGKNSASTSAVALGVVVLAGAAAGLEGGVGWLVAVGAVLAAAGLVIWLSVRRLGGYTGDVLGASIVVGESAGLVVAAAKW